MTLQNLKKELLKAKKEKNKIKSNSLMMIIDTIEKIAKEKNEKVSEVHIQKGIKKYLKQLEDARANFMPVEDELKFVKDLAKQILPKELDKNEIIEIVEKCLAENYNFGQIMQELKKHPVNMKEASQIVKDMMKG